MKIIQVLIAGLIFSATQAHAQHHGPSGRGGSASVNIAAYHDGMHPMAPHQTVIRQPSSCRPETSDDGGNADSSICGRD